MNIIAVNSDGLPTNLNVDTIPDDINYERYLNRIISSISQAKRVVIFVHGGLTRPQEAIERFGQLTTQMQEDGIVPVFIVWNSGLVSSYLESLLWIRRGSAYKKGFHRWMVQLLTPFLILEDVARGITRFIPTTLVAMGRDAQNNDCLFAKVPHWFPLKRRYQLSLTRFFGQDRTNSWVNFVQSAHSFLQDRMTIHVGADLETSNKRFLRFILYWVLFLPHLVSHTILDAIGKRAWDNMLRRTRTITSYNPDVHDPGYQPPVQRFFKALSTLQFPSSTQVDIIGHSMGSIVINEVIQQNPGLRFDNIVYMGAACTVRSFCESVGKYLDAHEATKFFNLCLHPRAEVSEYNWVVARGSLLAWIDNFFADILTYEDRTMGSFENCVSCFETIRTYRAVTLKSFSADDESVPQKHGDFTRKPSTYRFWDERYWA